MSDVPDTTELIALAMHKEGHCPPPGDWTCDYDDPVKCVHDTARSRYLDEATKIIKALAEAGYEIVKPVEGMGYTGGLWTYFPTEHRVEIETEHFFLSHPLSCRVEGLKDCEVHAAICESDGPPAQLGEYTAVVENGRLKLWQQNWDGEQ